MKSLYPTYIRATNLDDTWFQCLQVVLNRGRRFTVDKGSYAGAQRVELDFIMLYITHPTADPMLPVIPAHIDIPAPVDADYLDNYLPKLMTSHKDIGEQYTYGERLSGGSFQVNPEAELPVVGQIDAIIETYKLFGHRNNQMVLRVCKPSDLKLSDPPCLCHIDTRIQDDRLHFMPYFRSWDAWGGLPANLAGITMLMQYMAAEIGVEPGEIIACSKGLHLYGYAVDYAMRRCGQK